MPNKLPDGHVRHTIHMPESLSTAVKLIATHERRTLNGQFQLMLEQSAKPALERLKSAKIRVSDTEVV